MDAFIREIHEETETEITNIKYIGTLENIFTFNGGAGHGIVQVYDASFVDISFYMKKCLKGRKMMVKTLRLNDFRYISLQTAS